MIRLYVDEDASEAAVMAGLRARGVDLLTTTEAGRCGASDVQQLEFATDRGRVIYTFNAGDFARLHREMLQRGQCHAGIVVIPEQRYSIGDKVRRLAKFVQSSTTGSMMSRIEFL